MFLDPTFMDMERDPGNAMIITVLVGAHRPIKEKRKPVAAINRLVVAAVDVSPDDILIALIPEPNENFSFGKGRFNWRRHTALAGLRRRQRGDEER